MGAMTRAQRNFSTAPKSVLAMVLIVVAALATVSVAAHMSVAKSVPAANATLTAVPAQLQIWFTQPPDPAISRIQLFGPSEPVKVSGVRAGSDRSLVADVIGPAPGAGRYRVRWQSAGDDGHVQRGEFAFTVSARP